MTGSALVLRADARSLPLPDASVDLVVTSPPYFALRSYTDGGEHYDGQIGSEATPQEYIANLIDCTREWARVLKPGGSIWVNLGDKYGRGSRTTSDGTTGKRCSGDFRHVATGLDKSLMMLPERYRIAAVDELGLIARAVVVWSKPNGLPESVTDRVRRSHEDWVHLTKLPRYFSAVDEIREQSTPQRGLAGTFKRPRPSHDLVPGQAATQHRSDRADALAYNPLGKLPGSVWEIATEPLKVPDPISHARCCNGAKREGCDDGLDHYAAYPTEWPRRIILGWSPSGICTVCGEGRRPVAAASRAEVKAWALDQRGGRSWHGDGSNPTRALGVPAAERNRRITGEACACPEPTAPIRPSAVLDPFGGTGTAALVASALGRVGISVDRSADYCRLAQWRTTDRAQLAKAMRVPPPPKVHEAQLDLFGEVA